MTARPAGPVMRALLSTWNGRSPPAIVESAERASGEWADAISAGIPSESHPMVDTPRAA